MTANCTLFSPDGSRIYAGYQRSIGVFDTQRAGLPISLDSTSPTRRSKDGVRGIISCLAFSPTSQVLACGSFSGQISLRSADSTTASVWPVPAEYAGQGVAHLQWSPNGMLLWAAPRQSRHIVAWDVRDLRGPYAVVERPATTQQRMAFDFDSMGRFLVAGQMDGSLAFHDICGLDSAEDRDVARVPAHDDLVAGVACHPHYALLATAAGQRRFSDYGDDEPVAAGRSMCSPSLKLWSLGAQYFEREIQA
ncbi:hypothetical protein EC988_008859 [Linderina pennispora]|nr:hypothetical protein EC988_008859 [Linderina pennispora]